MRGRGTGDEKRDERGYELADVQVRERFIMTELVGVGADCALVYLLNDV